MSVSRSRSTRAEFLQSCLYEGWIRHRRFSPVEADYRYSVYLAYLDLDELPAAFEDPPLYSVKRPALVRFRRRDHLGSPDVPLSDAVRQLVRRRTGRELRGPIRLLTLLRHFGYCFRPVSFFYCFDDNETQLDVLVAEVNNTPWGERYCYVIDAGSQQDPVRAMRTRQQKVFHVSPFIDMDVTYSWHVTVPGHRLVVHVENRREGETFFDATLALRRIELTRRSLARVFLRHPLQPFKVISAIHWQAFKLWWRRVPVQPHPGPPNDERDRTTGSSG